MSDATRRGLLAAAAVLAISFWLSRRHETSSVVFEKDDRQDRTESSASTPASPLQRAEAVKQFSTTRSPRPPQAMAATRNAGDRERAVDAPSAGSGSEEISGAKRLAVRPDVADDEIDLAWEKEESNAQLSREVEEAALANFVADDIDPNVLLAVDCRDSACRFELDPANGLALVQLATRAANDGVQGKRAFVSRPDGTQVVAFYLPNNELRLGAQD
jgi:hypothetical protein